MQGPHADHPPPHVLTPRYSLRSLLIAVTIAAVLVQIGPFAWRRFLGLREAGQNANLQAAKTWPSSSLKSYVIDEGRGVPDDFVVLVRRGDTFGCFIPRNQNQRGESAEYEWYYRTDGQGRFAPSDPQVKSGHGLTGPYISGSGKSLNITFGPFEIPWSGHGPGWGFVYFDYNPVPPDRSAPDVLRICSTNIKSLHLLDARDPRWLYKPHRQDVGLHGNESANRAPSQVAR